TESATITLGYYASVDSVCCGSSCSTSCVVNGSNLTMPKQCSPAAPPPTLGFFPVSVSPLNEDITTWTNGSVYAGKFNGIQNLGGVPFNLQTDADGDNVFWGTELNLKTYSGSSSLTLTLAPHLYGATTVYTLINSAWGTAGSNVGSITFVADNGDSHTVQLVEGVNVRDHYYGSYVNTVSADYVTLNVMGSNTPDTSHLDMQAFALPTSFATKTLTGIVFTSTGSEATGLPFLAGVTAKAEKFVGTTLITPYGFNCVEAGANALSGHLYTQLSGTPFAFDVVALEDGNGDGSAGAVATTYASDVNRSVTVELVDGSGDNTACAQRSTLSPPVSQTLVFGQTAQASELGRKSSAPMTVSHAYPNLRCRVTDASQASPVVGCSADSFAVRPTDFSVTSNADGSSTIKAGAGFSLTAASGVAGYDGTPKLDAGKVAAHTGASATGSLAGTFAAADSATGAAGGTDFSYSEVGYFSLAAHGVYDDQFTAVDALAGDCSDDFSNTGVDGRYGCKFGNTGPTSEFGRFIPDHFDVELNAPVFAPACNSFSYIGQPIKYATNPIANVTARNTAGAVTRNYTGGFWKIAPNQAGYAITPSYSEAVHPLTELNLNAPTVQDLGNGSGVLTFADTESHILGITRGDPVAPFNAEIAMSFNLRDLDGVEVGHINGAAGANPISFGAAGTGTGIAFTGGHKSQRWGRLNLGNAHGSELNALSVPWFSEYFTGTAFTLNSLDNCTQLNLSAQLKLGNPTTSSGSLQPGSTTMTLGTGSSTASLATATLVSGNANLNFSAPGAGNTGYIDLKGHFTDLPWLLFDWDHDGAHDDSPSARASFGLYKGNSQQIYLREVY
ncbi:MAG: hypothetical protein PHH11_16520, partial [Methylomonas sp.]|nr:hypothetical protein [Methylomonas sp.]